MYAFAAALPFTSLLSFEELERFADPLARFLRFPPAALLEERFRLREERTALLKPATADDTEARIAGVHCDHPCCGI